jgi:hypothetical protein
MGRKNKWVYWFRAFLVLKWAEFGYFSREYQMIRSATGLDYADEIRHARRVIIIK